MENIGCLRFLSIRQILFFVAFKDLAVRHRPMHKGHLQGQARPKACSMARETPCYIYEDACLFYARFAWRKRKS